MIKRIDPWELIYIYLGRSAKLSHKNYTGNFTDRKFVHSAHPYPTQSLYITSVLEQAPRVSTLKKRCILVQELYIVIKHYVKMSQYVCMLMRSIEAAFGLTAVTVMHKDKNIILFWSFMYIFSLFA
ncbi:hypothetical protein ACJX0J_019727 [Zea mays]